MELTLTVEGHDSVVMALNSIANVDLEPTLDEAAAILLDKMRKRFLAQVDPDGVPWKPSLAAQIRAKKGIDGGTLFASGTLFNSIQLYTEGPGTRAIGTDVPYGIFHQFGLGQVQRVFVGFSEEDANLVTLMIQQRIAQAIEAIS
jgi:phage virion morphogenesis protein